MTKAQKSSASSDRPATKLLKPGLYLVATPIGNLADITARALETLRAADIILCEDTRVTGKLLSHYGIHVPLAVYNDQSEHHNHDKWLDRMRAGQAVVLVSDAGMPLLSDPGYQLVHAVQDAGLYVTTLPGPSAILAALQLSGLPSDAFLFLGFLPNKSGERQTRLKSFADVPATLILFERAERVGDVLADLMVVAGDRQAAVVREITKLFEETRHGLASTLITDLQARPIKGEVVVVIDRGDGPKAFSDDDLRDRLRQALATHSVRDAAGLVADETGCPRKRIYDLALTMKEK